MKAHFLVPAAMLVVACSSGPQAKGPPTEPLWIHDPARAVDSGNMIFVGQGQDPAAERAASEAEAIAIGNLVNECSFAPKGTRIEDRYAQAVPAVHYAYAKISVTIVECEAAKRAVAPDEIRERASAALSARLERYQDGTLVVQEGEDEESDEEESGEDAFAIRDVSDYYVARELVARAKQAVILAPPGVYQPGSPSSTVYLARVTPLLQEIEKFESESPAVQATPPAWSQVRTSPTIRYPKGFPLQPGAPLPVGAVRPYAPATHGPAPREAAPNEWKKKKRRRWK